MTFDFSETGKVKTDMINDFSTVFKPKDTALTHAAENLFAEGESEELDTERAAEFHTFVAKGVFACKRKHTDIPPTIAALCTRVQKPNEDDWNKLHCLFRYINGTRKDKLVCTWMTYMSLNGMLIVHLLCILISRATLVAA
jgi:hypothetical protein